MDLIKNVIKYLLENPFYAAIVAVCGVAILALIFALCIKSSKAKRSIAPPTEPPQQPNIPASETQTVQSTVKSLEMQEDEFIETAVAPEDEVLDSRDTTFPEEVKREAVTQKSDLKTIPTENVNDVVIEQDNTESVEPPVLAETTQTTPEVNVKKTTRYNGKWLIWRLLTKTDDSDTVTEESYFFELVASNGEKLLSSEGYTSFSGAQKGIQTHKANILRNNFRVSLTKKGDYIFKLLSGKNTLLCTGENYPTKIRCENAVESTKRFAETAIIDENVHDLVIHLPAEDSEEVIVAPENGYNGKWIISSMLAPDGDQIFYFELFASNGEKLLSSEEYATYNGVINGINTHKNNIERNNFRISLTKRGDYIFKLLNANDQLLCLGEHYKTRRRCESAVESVKRFAKTAPIMDSPSVKKTFINSIKT